jgi:hypothetical protein
MMTQMSRDSLDNDRETLSFQSHRGTVRLHGARVASLLNRCGVEQRQWDHLSRRCMTPIRHLPALLQRAEKDRRNVVIDDRTEDDPPTGNAA